MLLLPCSGTALRGCRSLPGGHACRCCGRGGWAAAPATGREPACCAPGGRCAWRRVWAAVSSAARGRAAAEAWGGELGVSLQGGSAGRAELAGGPAQTSDGGMCAGRRLGGGMGTLPSWRATCPIPARPLPPRASVLDNKLLDAGQRTGSRDRGCVCSAGAASAGHKAWDATGRPVLRGKPTEGLFQLAVDAGGRDAPPWHPAGRPPPQPILVHLLTTKCNGNGTAAALPQPPAG